MAMDNISFVLPFIQPVNYCNLKRGKAVDIVIITINFFPVEKAVNINEVKIEAELIMSLFNNCIIKRSSS